MQVPLATPLLATHLLKTPSEVDCKSLSCQLKKKCAPYSGNKGERERVWTKIRGETNRVLR